MSTAARFAAAYVALWSAHDLADHVVQTDAQAAGKGAEEKGWARPLAGHVATYTATQAAGLAAARLVGVRPSLRRALVALAWSAATHAFLDRRWPVVQLLRHTGSLAFANPGVRVTVRGSVTPSALRQGAPLVEGTGAGPLPLHGPYLADQALHHVAVAIAAGIVARGTR